MYANAHRLFVQYLSLFLKKWFHSQKTSFSRSFLYMKTCSHKKLSCNLTPFLAKFYQMALFLLNFVSTFFATFLVLKSENWLKSSCFILVLLLYFTLHSSVDIYMRFRKVKCILPCYLLSKDISCALVFSYSRL